MKCVFVLVAWLSLSACAALDCSGYVGLALHPEAIDAPESRLQNPLGIAGAECRRGQLGAFVEHESGILKTETGGGYNTAGIKFWFD